jgi:hypothetical protein
MMLKPGVIPPKIGQFLFNTCNTQSFDVAHLIPKTAREISVNIFMRSGSEPETSVFNV